MVIGAVGVLLLTRTIGPGAYGLYGAALGIYLYLHALSQWGVEVYLIRSEKELQPEDYHQAFSLLALLGLAGTGAALLALPLIESWVRLDGFEPVAIAMFAVLPVHLLTLVPLARLERDLDYRSVAWVELSAQMVYFLVALPLAYQGAGPWAPVAGWWARQLLTLIILYWVSGYRPRFYWETGRARAMVGYGLGFSASTWVWQLRNLVSPLIVGRYAGAEAVGYVTLAIRLVEQLSFVKQATWRLSIAAFARMQGERSRLVNALTEGMSLQVMALGPILAGFGLVAPWLLPYLFGSSWTPVLAIYPFIALSYLSNAVFNMHASALYVLRRNWLVTYFHVLHIVLFAGSAFLLTPILGLEGYGWAEVLALPSYVLIHIWVASYVGKPRYVQAGVWFLASAIPLFAYQLGPWAYVSLLVPLAWATTRKEMLQILRTMIGTIRGSRASSTLGSLK